MDFGAKRWACVLLLGVMGFAVTELGYVAAAAEGEVEVRRGKAERPKEKEDEKETEEEKEARLISETREALVGENMPRLYVKDWINGRMSRGLMEGKFVVVQFWAAWCSDSLNAIPANNEFWKDYHGGRLVFFGICSSDRDQDKMKEVVKESNIRYPVVKDPELKTMRAWEIERWPTYVLVAPDGEVVAVEGSIELIIKKLSEMTRLQGKMENIEAEKKQ
ncbi:TlpA family protein disulfide reductase [Poriferisphaera sp. WC338]|uniref:TlpA family protein disulfide reductase n=1 Tax=Poriferisphaera sp. WC338 TaxID=3425129 RepID=UPI003D8129ED